MTEEQNPSGPATAQDESILTDVAIVGGGLAGSLAAAVLARSGYRVVLIDKRAVYPEEFRVEKISGQQVDSFRRLGFLDALSSLACSYDRTLNIRDGRLVDVSTGLNFGIPYADLVAMARQLVPDPCFMVDQVLQVKCSETLQHLTLASGRSVTSRIVVLATGMSAALAHNIGITKRVLAARHSVTFGFTIASSDGGAFPFPSLTCYGDRSADGIDYLSIFPIAGGMRANLFMFRNPDDPVMRELRREPKATLFRLMPGLAPYLGDFQVVDRVQSWVMDIAKVEGHLQPGVVLIGDAFQTSCPAAGTGVSRLLVDIERLCSVHLPEWLTTAGMDADKISQFYSDGDKVASDDHAFRMAHFRQALTSNDGMRWNMRRRMHFLRRNITHRVDRIRPGWIARVRGALRA